MQLNPTVSTDRPNLPQQEIHQAVLQKSEWQGRSIQLACPRLLAALDALDLREISVQERRDLVGDLRQIYEGIGTNQLADDTPDRQTRNKIDALVHRLQEDAPAAKRTKVDPFEMQIELIEYSSRAKLRRFFKTVQTAKGAKPLAEATRNALFELLKQNRKLFRTSDRLLPQAEYERINKENLALFAALKAIDRSLLKDLLVALIEGKEISLQSVLKSDLDESELLDLAPHLTYVVFDGPSGRSEEFLAKFLQKSIKLISLHILNLPEFTGVSLTKLDTRSSIRSLHISGCSNFNHALPQLDSLEFLYIWGCSYDQPLPPLPALTNLSFQRCPLFNQRFSDLPRLQHLDITNCPAFELLIQPLRLAALYCNTCAENYVKGTKDYIGISSPFKQKLDQFLLQVMAQDKELPLKWLDFLQLYAAYGDIQELTQQYPGSHFAFMVALIKFSSGSPKSLYTWLKTTNRLIQGLEALQNLMLEKSMNLANAHRDDTSRDLEGQDKTVRFRLLQFLSPNLRHKTVYEFSESERKSWLSSPNLYNRVLGRACDVQTAENTLHKESSSIWWFVLPVVPTESFLAFIEKKPIDTHAVYLAWANDAQKKAYHDDLSIAIKILLEELKGLINTGRPDKEIWDFYCALQASPNFAQFVREILVNYPKVAGYMIDNHKDEIVRDAKKADFNYSAQLLGVRMCLLTMLPADLVKVTISEVEDETKKFSMDMAINIQGYSGPIRQVLRQIYEANFVGTAPQIQAQARQILIQKLPEIQLMALAAMATSAQEAPTLIGLLELFSDTQLTVIVPLLPIDLLLERLKTLPTALHARFLVRATGEQQNGYLQRDLFMHPLVEQWNKQKSAFQVMVNDFRQAPASEKLALLEEQYTMLRGQMSALVIQNRAMLQTLQAKLANVAGLEAYVRIKVAQLQAMENEMRDMGTLISNEFAPKVSRHVKIPDEFLDAIMKTPMSDPYTDGFDHICDKATWASNRINPFNRQPLTISPVPELKQKIEEFKKQHPELF